MDLRAAVSMALPKSLRFGGIADGSLEDLSQAVRRARTLLDDVRKLDCA